MRWYSLMLLRLSGYRPGRRYALMGSDETPYWSQDFSELAAALESGPDGLSSDRAAARLLSIGPNSVEHAPRLSALRLLLRQFQSPLVLILAFAAAISLALQQWVDAAIILAIG
ncbi:MAG: cation-transporting P-type ATPase, partial [Candidatus Binatia bacterium]